MQPEDTSKESAEVSAAFKALENEERVANNQKHKLSVKQVIGIVVVMALAPIAALWGFSYLG